MIMRYMDKLEDGDSEAGLLKKMAPPLVSLMSHGPSVGGCTRRTLPHVADSGCRGVVWRERRRLVRGRDNMLVNPQMSSSEVGVWSFVSFAVRIARPR